MCSDSVLVPLLKWAGGKRWFVSAYSHLIPHFSGRYIEPFLGSGAVFFSLRPQSAVLGDRNRELVDTYRAVKDDWRAVSALLRYHLAHHSADYYYRIRSFMPGLGCEKAARLIYLNRMCWNGLYRVNARGEFNVPLGGRADTRVDDNHLERVSEALQKAELRDCGFESLIEEAGRGDLLFVDPPYTVCHSKNGFIKYNEALFSWADQERLAGCLIEAQERGAYVVATNAPHDSVRALYDRHFTLLGVGRFSPMSGKAESRGTYNELIILSPSRVPSLVENLGAVAAG